MSVCACPVGKNDRSGVGLWQILFLEGIFTNKPLGTEKHKDDQEGSVNDLSHVRSNGTGHT